MVIPCLPISVPQSKEYIKKIVFLSVDKLHPFENSKQKARRNDPQALNLQLANLLSNDTMHTLVSVKR
jgi:hypothetical protein